MKKILNFFLVTVFCLSLSNCIPMAPMSGPPPLKRRIVVPRPGANFIWVQGNWQLRRGRWVWRNGYWMKQRIGHIWIKGHWVKRRGNWRWIPGRWKRI